METIHDLPEISNLDARRQLVRIPDQLDVPLTKRVQRVIDTAEFRRLAKISQLGLVSLVYPAAHHTRFEHSLGVYRIALLYLKQLAQDPRFAAAVTGRDAELMIVAALLHDLGHWPFCHAIEDIDLPGVPEHELFANSFLLEGDLADALRDSWGTQPREVVALLSEPPRDPAAKILHSLLSGPIDVDKMDYLVRDSLHAGVPYGRNFDQQRLIGSLCLNQAGDALAISDKGRTAAEMMVFSRYVMFSEVYWHHAVRSATAMFQRAFYLLHHRLNLDSLFRQTEAEMIGSLLQAAGEGPAKELLDGLFGPVRRLYKRVAQFSYFEQRELYQRLARRPYPWLVSCAEEFASVLSRHIGRRVAPTEILFDAPPMKLEVEFQIEIFFRKEGVYRPLGEVSPVVQSLARQQFDDYVKRVRVFGHPRVAAEVKDFANLSAALLETLERMG
ncbi:MAG TPA: HD domain-containing protein [Candidatus Anammoximicrobium sp.]|nr:HD domain-containing protein [Candidatus Anammoximicrobium sp.]